MARQRTRSRSNLLVRQLVILAAVVVVVVISTQDLWVRLTRPNEGPARTWVDYIVLAEPDFAERCGAEESIRIMVVHSPDQSAWLQAGAEHFMLACPNTQVRLIERTDFDAIEAIESGELEPTLWAPSDEVFAWYLEDRWVIAHPGAKVSLEYGPSLLRSPLVLVVWTERLGALDRLWPRASQDPTFFAGLVCAGLDPSSGWQDALSSKAPAEWSEWWNAAFTAPRRFPASPTEAELRSWGRVDFEHLSPTRAPIGAITAMLMAHGFVRYSEAEEFETREDFEHALEASNYALEGWVEGCEANQESFEGSPRRLAQHMLMLDTGSFDGIFVPENFALEMLAMLDAAESGPPRARVIYPRYTLSTNHPTVYFPGSEGQRAAARRFTDLLVGAEAQTRAVESGFRPGDETLSVRDAEVEHNPFLELRHFGVTLRPELREPPRLGRAMLRELIETWSDATGRQ